MKNEYDVVIAGAGPAGSAASIHLAGAGLSVLLLEQKRFPRPKLCGEFISPECQLHFQSLGVAKAMELSAPAKIVRTSFYGRGGKRVDVPSSSFGGVALGLSRALMDYNLLERARQVGVEILEGAKVSHVLRNTTRVTGLRYKSVDGACEVSARVVIDATGRNRLLCRKVRDTKTEVKRSKLIAFKAHFTNTKVEPGSCEIYVYRGGYGGLSSIEGDRANLCFIVNSQVVQRCGSNPDDVVDHVVMKNRRASATLENATRCSEWLSASWERFGGLNPSPIPGLLAIGDSAAFIDPFTGSGMLMALDSADLVSRSIVLARNKLVSDSDLRNLSADYVREYSRKFSSRLRLCSFLRYAAFTPLLAESIISLCSISSSINSLLARATRGNENQVKSRSPLHIKQW